MLQVLVERSSDWLLQARRDLDNAEYEVKGGFHEWACFLAQQSAEKAVKAVYQKMGGEAFGHSVAALLGKLPKRFRPPKRLVNMARELDRAYIPTGYPNAHPQGPPYEAYTREDSERMIKNAKEIYRFSSNMLSKI